MTGKAETAGEVEAEAGGADLGYGQAAGGDDERLGFERAVVGLEVEAVGARDVGHFGLEADGGARGVAFGEEHGDDLAGGAVAEELAEGLFVPGDGVTVDEVDEVLRGVAGEGGAAEAGIVGPEAVGVGMQIGEVAATAAGDEDLFAGLAGVIEHEDAAAAAGGGGGGHQPRRRRRRG